MDRTQPRNLLFVIVTASLAVAALDAVLHSRHLVGADNLVWVWSVSFYVLTAMWVVADSDGRAAIYRPYDFGFLIYFILPGYLPYYLLRTRGAAGLLWLAGFVCLYLASWLLRLAAGLGGS